MAARLLKQFHYRNRIFVVVLQTAQRKRNGLATGDFVEIHSAENRKTTRTTLLRPQQEPSRFPGSCQQTPEMGYFCPRLFLAPPQKLPSWNVTHA